MTSSSAPAREPARPDRVSLPLQLLFALSLVVAMVLLAGALLWQGWAAGRDVLFDATRDRAQAMGRLIAERVEARVVPASTALDYLASGLVPDITPPDGAGENLEGLKVVLSSMSFASAVTVAPESGGFLMMQRVRPERAERADLPAGTAYVVERIRADGSEAGRAMLGFYDAALTLLGERDAGPTGFDPRRRDWYRTAPDAPEQSLSAPYLFASSHELGMTLSERMKGGRVVVGLDIALVDLGTELAGMKPTPGAELALLTGTGDVIAASGDARLAPGMWPTLPPVLRDLRMHMPPPGRSIVIDRAGESWFGMAVPLTTRLEAGNVVLLAIPEREILATLRGSLSGQFWLAAGITAVFLLLGWVAGRHLGRGLSELSAQAQRFTRFDFARPRHVGSLIREIADFHAVLDAVSGTIRDFLASSEAIATEARLDRMLEEVLARTVNGTACTRGTVYLVDEARGVLVREARVAIEGAPPDTLPAELALDFAAEEAVLPVVPEPGTGLLVLPLRNRLDRPVGLLVLVHDRDALHRGDAFGAFARKLSGMLAVSIETRRLFESQRQLLDGFIRLIADAVDAKSPYTGAHCRRVPELATMIVDTLVAATDGPYRDFRFGEDERYAFQLGAWLHDCGKVTSAEHIIDKATKLETVHNRIHEVRTRFEVLLRDATIAHLERLLAGVDAAVSVGRLADETRALTDDFAFVAGANVGSESMTDADLDRLTRIAARTWVRHFDDRLGLSVEERARHAGRPETPLPATEPLLADRPEHVSVWDPARRPPVEAGDPANRYGFDMHLPQHRQNLGELHNLSIRHGTLNDAERFQVNDHVVQTYIMLKSLPWPDGLDRVPEIAATHHERMDGTGYPRRIGADGLSLPERAMALADVFEALTAADRPYKTPKPLSEALDIMTGMGTRGHLDPGLMIHFLRSGVWRDYAGRFLRPDQRDAVDVDALIARLAAAPPG